MENQRILIADDDDDIVNIISDLLRRYGYEVDSVGSAEAAFEQLAMAHYDLLLLDVNLPGDSGLAFCRQFRKLSLVPVIFLSARDSEDDRIAGLDIGGDDYIGKPFSLKELLSRVNSLMRRVYGVQSGETILRVGPIAIDTQMREVRKNGTEIKLALKEFDVLLYLAKCKNQAVKKDTLLNEVWGAFSTSEAATLSVHIRWLREKLEDDPANPKYIKTVWGVGYSLCDGETV